MRYPYIFLALFLSATTFLTAQNKQVSLEDIWGGKFVQQSLQSLQSRNNGKEFLVLNRDYNAGTTSLDVYEYKTGEKTGSLVNSLDLEAIQNFQDFTLSPNEDKILLATEVDPIFRHSTKAVYYIYNIATKELTKLSENKVQEPTFSPDASKVAYVFKNNIYIYDLKTKIEIQVTKDGLDDEIINGVTDWVYEEEFAFVKAFDWNKNGEKVAFLRFDETEVPKFSMDVFGADLYPTQHVFKYPKAGETNATVSLHIYDVASNATTNIDLGDYQDFYIPRIKWSQESNILSVQVLNRHQNKLDLIFVNSNNNSAKVVMTETDAAYVDVTDNLTFLEDNDYIWTSEKDGYNHIYLYDNKGKLVKQITKGDWEVTNYYGFDKKAKRIYFQSTENGSVNRDVYSISLKGKNKKRLTNRTGTNSATFSSNFTYFINSFTNVNTPREYTLHSAKDGALIRKIKDNKVLLTREKDYAFTPKELSTININGNDLNMYMIKPVNFDENKKYPLLMYQYSGPGSQSVSNSYFSTNDYWFQLLANKGVVIAVVDGRGTGYKGAEFKKLTYQELGKYELEDQIDAAKKLGERAYIDEDRIGIWGWSYGGYMSSNALFKGNDVFSMAIAVAPVTSWRFYDSIYTERYMRTPQENPSGYDDNSPLTHVDKLKGDFLLVHGSGDDNVHYQNAMRLVAALVQANKKFDMAIYPDNNHGIYGGNTRLHLYNKMTDFIEESFNLNKPKNTTYLK